MTAFQLYLNKVALKKIQLHGSHSKPSNGETQKQQQAWRIRGMEGNQLDFCVYVQGLR